MAATWVDLLDPSADELKAKAPRELEETALELLLAAPAHEDEPRPTLQGHGDYVFGVFLLAVALPAEDRVYYQEIDVVITHDTLLTVRKTPQNGRPPYDIEALEDKVEEQRSETTRQRISELRHDMLHIRRTLAPMRDAVRRIIMNAVEVEEGTEVFPQEVEVAFNAAYDKLLRALDGLDLSRDLLSSVRDYAQAKVANDQNEVMKRLTVIASLLLLPTFIVGLYGQNFVNIPELRWQFGYAYVWGVIVLTTFGQLWFFKKKNWF
jgi:Mg2+ and Co2+ transporter CorA